MVVFQRIGRSDSFSGPLFREMDSSSTDMWGCESKIIGEDGVQLLGVYIHYTPSLPLSVPMIKSVVTKLEHTDAFFILHLTQLNENETEDIISPNVFSFNCEPLFLSTEEIFTIPSGE